MTLSNKIIPTTHISRECPSALLFSTPSTSSTPNSSLHQQATNQLALRVELCDRSGVWSRELNEYLSNDPSCSHLHRQFEVFGDRNIGFWEGLQESLHSADLCVVFPGQLSISQTDSFCDKFSKIINNYFDVNPSPDIPEICLVLSNNQDVLVSSLKNDISILKRAQSPLRIEEMSQMSGRTIWQAISSKHTPNNVVALHRTTPTTYPSFNFVKPIESINMASLKESLDSIMTIDGALAVALVDFNSGMLLAKAGSAPINMDVAAAGNSEVLKAKLKTMKALGINEAIEDVLITLGTQYHVLRLMPSKPGLFLYFALDKAKGNLAMARYKLADAEKTLVV